MTEKEAIRELLEMRNMSQAKLAERAGYKTQSNIRSLLDVHKKNSMRVDNFFTLAKALGFEIILRDTMGTKTELVIDMKPKPKLEELD